MIDTLANVKSYLGITNTDKDVFLNMLLDQIDIEVKNYLNRDIEEATYTELYDGSGTSFLILRQFPVTTITTIEYWDTSSWTTIDSTYYYRLITDEEQNRIYAEGYTFAEGVLNYRITYTAGYSSVPKDIQSVFQRLVKLAYDNSPLKDNTLGKLSRVEGGSGGSLTVNLDPKIKEKVLMDIYKYKRINV